MQHNNMNNTLTFEAINMNTNNMNNLTSEEEIELARLMALGGIRKIKYCCSKQCFITPNIQVDGMACSRCRQFSYCRCECKSFKRPVRIIYTQDKEDFYAKKMHDKNITKQKSKMSKARQVQRGIEFRKFLKGRTFSTFKDRYSYLDGVYDLFNPVITQDFLDTISKLWSNTTTSINQLPTTLGTVESAATGISTITTTLQNLITSMQSQIDSTFKKLSHSMKPLKKILAALVNSLALKSFIPLWQCFCDLCIDFGVDVAAYEHLFVSDDLLQSDVDSFLNNEDIHGIGTQDAGSEEWLMESWFKYGATIPAAMTAIVMTVICFCSGVEFDMTKLMNYSSTVGRAVMGFNKAWDAISYIMNAIEDWFSKKMFGKTRSELKRDESYPQLSELLAASAKLMTLDYTSNCVKSKKSCEKIIRLADILTMYEQKAYAFNDRDIVAACKAAKLDMKKALEVARLHVNLNNDIRIPPVIIKMFGLPGVGKTEMMQLLVSSLSTQYFEGASYKNLVYDRKVENEFWDGYLNHHKIVKYDDAFQLPDTVAAPNPEFMEMIRISNSDSYQLHMSAVEDKKSTFFGAEFVMVTTNVRNPVALSLKDMDAFRRRITIDMEVKVNPKFGHMTQVGNHRHITVDKVKIFKYQNPTVTDVEIAQLIADGDLAIAPCNKVYECHVKHVDMITGVQVEEVLNYSQVFDLIKRKRKSFQNDHKEKETDAYIVDESPEFKECLDNPILTQDEGILMQTTVGSVIRHSRVKTIVTRETLLELDDMRQDEIIYLEGPEGAKTLVRQEVIDLQLTEYETDVAKVLSMEDDDLNLSVTEEEREKLTTLGKIQTFAKDKWTQVCNASHSIVKWIMEHVRILVPIALSVSAALLAVYAMLGKCTYAKKLQQPGRVLELFAYRTCLFNCKFCTELKNNPVKGVSMIERVATTGSKTGRPSGFLTYHPLEIVKWMKHIKHTARVFDLEIHPGYLNEATDNALDYASTLEKEQYKLSDIFVESHQDPRTKTNIYTESHQDAKNKTNIYTESHQDNKAKTNIFTEEYDNIVVEDTTDQTASNIGTKIHLSSLVKLHSPSGRSCHGLFVRGRFLITNLHFALDHTTLELVNTTDPGGVRHTTQIVSSTPLIQGGEKIDLVLLEVGINIPPHPDIVSSFITPADMPKLASGYECGKARLFKTVESGKRIVPTIEVVDNVQVFDKDLISHSPTGKVYKLMQYASYSANAQQGDCGSPIILYNPAVQHKITGIHSAGRTGEGYAQIVTQKMLERAMQGKKTQIVVQSGMTPQEESILPNTTSVGTVERGIHYTNSSSIRKSPIYGAFEVKKAPANLSRHGLIANSLKMTKETILLDENKLDICQNDITNTLERGTNRNKPVRRSLTHAEAIAGIENVSFIDVMSRGTSPGYPYVQNADGMPGKTKWLGQGEEVDTTNKEILDIVNRMEEAAEQGIVIPELGIFTAALKDERRALNKLHKTRVYTSCNIALSILIRKHTLGFVKWCCDNRIENEIGLGTNVYSQDWNQIKNKITKTGGKVIAGDFSNFDGSLNSQILMRIPEIMSSWYRDDKDLLRKTLFTYLVNATVIFGDELIQLNHSQPSGNPLTTLINCMYNMFIFRYTYLMAQEDLGMTQTLSEYKTNVSAVFYGDDSVIGISEKAVKWFNQETITEYMKETGHEYTDEEKTGTCVPFRGINEINFLKRTFRSREGATICPITKDTIEDMVMWTRKNIKTQDFLDQTVNMAAFEAHYHGEEYFNKFTGVVKSECHLAQIYPQLSTYREYVDISLGMLGQLGESEELGQFQIPTWIQWLRM